MKKYLVTLALILPLVVFAQTFDHDLYFGIQGDSEVTKLQEFLTDQGIYSGPITGNFFSLTLTGIKNFQSREGITPAAGYFGPKTRAAANAILSQQLQASNEQAVAETSSTPPVPTPPATTNDIQNSLQAQLNLLIQQVALLQKQLAAQQQTNFSPSQPPPALVTQSTIPSQNASVQSTQPQTQLSIPIYISSMDSSGNVNATTTDPTKAVDFPNCKLPDDWLNRMRAAGFNYNSVTIFEIATGVQCPSAASHSAHTALAQFEQNALAVMPYISFSIPAGALQPTTPRIIVLPLVASPNSALVSPISISAGSANVKIGSYTLTAYSAEGVYVSNITLALGLSASSSFRNLMVVVGGLQFGETRLSATSTIETFDGLPFTVPAGGSVNVDVYADILPTASSMDPATTLNQCVACGAVTYNSIGCTNKSVPPIAGQGITITE